MFDKPLLKGGSVIQQICQWFIPFPIPCTSSRNGNRYREICSFFSSLEEFSKYNRSKR